MLNRCEIPIDLEPIARLLRRPERVCDNGDAGPFADRRDLKDIDHAGNASRSLVVERSHRCAEDRRPRDQSDLHAGHIEVESELLRAVALGATVETGYPLPYETKIRRALELHGRRNWPAAG